MQCSAWLAGFVYFGTVCLCTDDCMFFEDFYFDIFWWKEKQREENVQKWFLFWSCLYSCPVSGFCVSSLIRVFVNILLCHNLCVCMPCFPVSTKDKIKYWYGNIIVLLPFATHYRCAGVTLKCNDILRIAISWYHWYRGQCILIVSYHYSKEPSFPVC